MKKSERTELGHRYGLHRVLDEKRCLPQAAEKLDNSLPIYSNEILIEVDRLNIDAASFVQMEQETSKSSEAIGKIVLENCRNRGKQQNRLTGSGGMLTGKVKAIGKDYDGPLKAKVGDRVASLVSLTLTPLQVGRIKNINLSNHQIEVEDSHAILFESSIGAVLPKGVPEAVAMAIYDVAGAPATVDAMVKAGQTVVVIGAGGKAGLLSCVAARKKIGAKKGKLIGIEPGKKACEELEKIGVCDHVLPIDATDPIAVFEAVEKLTRGKLADLVIAVAPVPHTENSALLCVKPRGKVLFYSMATSFTKVALGAEGIASEATLFFGNGYYPNHAKFAVDLVKRHKKVFELFVQRYGA